MVKLYGCCFYLFVAIFDHRLAKSVVVERILNLGTFLNDRVLTTTKRDILNYGFTF